MHFKRLVYAGYKQVRNVTRLVRGEPLTFPSFSSMTLDDDDVALAKEWLKKPDRWYQPEEIEQYHKTFATWNGSSYAFSFMAGRVALSAVIHALEMGAGDEVILPAYTCVVVPNAFHYAGVRTVFSDIELETYGLDASYLEEKITPKTKAILLHHLYGLVCRDYESIIDIAHRHNLYVIEDCAHSTGAEYRGIKVGNLGDVAFYSSEQSKVFNTVQGGIATTNSNTIAGRLADYYEAAPYPDENWIDKQLHNLILNYYRHKHVERWWRDSLMTIRIGHKELVSTTREEEQGIRPQHYGRKMPAPTASLGINQLQKIDTYNEFRRQTAKRWDQWCEMQGYRKPLVLEGSTPVYLRYPVLVEPEKKQDFTWAIKELGLVPGVWFRSHLHPVQGRIEGCPNADEAVKRCVNFPTILNDHIAVAPK